MNGINIALSKLTKSNDEIPPFITSKIVDGTLDPFNRWAAKVPAWIYVDLNSQITIGRWVVKNMSCVTGWESPKYDLIDFKLQKSNDSIVWDDVDIVTDNILSIVDREIAPVSARYFRVYVSKGLHINPGIASIMELELYQTNSTSSYLSDLSFNVGDINSPFSKEVSSYTVNIGENISDITLTPTVEDSRANVTINGTSIYSGDSFNLDLLQSGSTPVVIKVIPFIGPIRDYNINIMKEFNLYISNIILSYSGDRFIYDSMITPNNNELNYKNSVNPKASYVALTFMTEDVGVLIKINDTEIISSGQKSSNISLAPINTNIPKVINLKVSGNNFVSFREYTLNIIYSY